MKDAERRRFSLVVVRPLNVHGEGPSVGSRSPSCLKASKIKYGGVGSLSNDVVVLSQIMAAEAS